jgi:hypothetical protein
MLAKLPFKTSGMQTICDIAGFACNITNLLMIPTPWVNKYVLDHGF